MPHEPKDNLIDQPPAGPGTHVLVIGVSQYRHLADGPDPTNRGEASRLDQLTSAARSAALFAKWMIKNTSHTDRPLCSLRIALSPSPGEQIPAEISQRIADGDHSATRDHIVAALLAFRQDCQSDAENVAVVYIAGHGVQITKQGATVLLADYGSDAHLNELDSAVDMVSVHRGMNGNGFPERQFWFVDACRQRPAVARRFESLKGAIGLDEPNGVVKSSPIYLATVSGALAFGIPNEESLFCRALLWALEDQGAALEPGTLSPGWHVSVTSLAVALPARVQALAEEFNAEQSVEIAGHPNEALFHMYPETPTVELHIQLRPQAALPCERTLKDKSFNEVQLADNAWPLQTTLAAGLYQIEYRPSGQFSPGGKLMKVSPPGPKQDTIDVKP